MRNNKQRKKKEERRCAETNIGEWKKYFMRLLREVEHKIVREVRRASGEKSLEKNIGKEKIRKVIKKLKGGKAAGINGTLSEAWKYGEKRLEKWVQDFCNRVCRGEGWSKSWREGIIVPIVKKEKRKRAENHRRVTVMPTLYTIYAMILISD